MDLSQSSLAWTLISSAVRMAQDAGYHRLPSFSVAPEATQKRCLFWFIYCIERGMALNFGRASSIQDWDIQSDRPRYPEEIKILWGPLFSLWFDFAKIQGEIYEQLYCARAQKQAIEVKAELARGLAVRLCKVKESMVFQDLDKEPFAESMREGLLSISIVQNSTLTLVYRMIPPTAQRNGPVHPLKFCDEAVETAREALTTHNEAWIMLQDRSKDEWRIFVHWTLLLCPFVSSTCCHAGHVAFGMVVSVARSIPVHANRRFCRSHTSS